jgi:hypothetical protein
MSDTPKTDEMINALHDETRHVGPHNCPERWVRLCRELERENARLLEFGEKMCSELGNLAWLSGHFLPNEAEKAVEAWTYYLSTSAITDPHPKKNSQ